MTNQFAFFHNYSVTPLVHYVNNYNCGKYRKNKFIVLAANNRDARDNF